MFSFGKPQTHENRNKTYYYYISVGSEQKADGSYDYIFSEVKAASCEWPEFGRSPINLIVLQFDNWFEDRYDDTYKYHTGYDAIGSKMLFESRAKAENARNEDIANKKNSNIKYNIIRDNGFSYTCE